MKTRLYTAICLTFAFFLIGITVQAATEPTASPSAEIAEARDIIGEIVDVIGLKMHFTIQAAEGISNASAVTHGNKRFILYDKSFVASVNNAVNTDWAGVSILAHEIGHHLNGHTLNDHGSTHTEELEADEFSGFVLRKMGASLSDAQAAMYEISSEHGSATHPKRTDRLKAIEAGWQKADAQILAEASPHNKSRVRVKASRENSAQPTNIDKRYIVREIIFSNESNSKYFLTKEMNLIKETESGIEIVGKATRSSLKEFHYVLDKDNSKLFVTPNGEVVNSHNEKVGFLKEPLA